MRRREFIGLALGTATWPLAAQAQQSAMPVIGIIGAGSRDGFEDLLAKLRDGLREFGYVEGRNIAVEYRFAEGQFDQLPRLGEDLARRGVAVMISLGVGSSLAAKRASPTIPHVFLSQDDPVKLGFVTSFNRPGGSATGVAVLTAELATKRVELTRLLGPGAPLAYLMNPFAPEAPRYLREIEDITGALKLPFITLKAGKPGDIDSAFVELVRQRAGTLIVSTDGYLFSRREQIVALAARHKVPTVYDRRGYVAAGGLVSYGTDLAGAYRQIGLYAGRILKGEKPADLPVVQPTRFELVVNLKTAKALGIDLPAQVLALADEVIE